jgi:peptide/nickel transport system permease protein
MARFVARRIAAAVGVLLIISVLTFLLFQTIPIADPARRIGGRLATAQEIAQIRHEWGFDRPIYVQYFRTMEKIFSGTVVSYSQGVNVLDQIRRGLPATLSLAIGAGFIWLTLGILFGTVTAIKAGRFADRALTVMAFIGVSSPPFFLGALVIYYLGYKAGVVPVGGYVPLTQDPVQWFTHLIAPWLVLSVLFIGIYSRVLRSTILDTVGEDYVRTARAKGISERRVLIRHVLRNSLIPIISLWGLDFAQIIGGGAILTESVFSLHGVGQFAAESIGRLDLPPILVVTMLTAFAVVLLSAIVDILYAVLDPRIRLSV